MFYRSLEAFAKVDVLTPKTDIWSSGVILHQLLFKTTTPLIHEDSNMQCIIELIMIFGDKQVYRVLKKLGHDMTVNLSPEQVQVQNEIFATHCAYQHKEPDYNYNLFYPSCPKREDEIFTKNAVKLLANMLRLAS